MIIPPTKQGYLLSGLYAGWYVWLNDGWTVSLFVIREKNKEGILTRDGQCTHLIPWKKIPLF